MQKKVKLHKSKTSNTFFTILLISGIVFVFFLGSKSFLWDDSDIIQTAYGKENKGLSSNYVTLNDWQYNPNNGLMEVVVTIESKGQSASEVEFFAKEKSNPLTKIPVKVASHYDNKYTLLIEKIPNDYSAVGLVITEKSSNKELVVNTNNLFDTDEIEKSLGQNEKESSRTSLTIYGDYRKVKVNKELKVLTVKDYVLESIQYDIESFEKKKDDLSKVIPKQEEQITSIKNEISELEEDKSFQTSDELRATDAEIKVLQSSIKDVELNKSEIEKAIETLDEKINKLKEKKQKEQQHVDEK